MAVLTDTRHTGASATPQLRRYSNPVESRGARLTDGLDCLSRLLRSGRRSDALSALFTRTSRSNQVATATGMGRIRHLHQWLLEHRRPPKSRSSPDNGCRSTI